MRKFKMIIRKLEDANGVEGWEAMYQNISVGPRLTSLGVFATKGEAEDAVRKFKERELQKFPNTTTFED